MTRFIIPVWNNDMAKASSANICIHPHNTHSRFGISCFHLYIYRYLYLNTHTHTDPVYHEQHYFSSILWYYCNMQIFLIYLERCAYRRPYREVLFLWHNVNNTHIHEHCSPKQYRKSQKWKISSLEKNVKWQKNAPRDDWIEREKTMHTHAHTNTERMNFDRCGNMLKGLHKL